MSLQQHQPYTVPFPLIVGQKKPRLFILEYDHSKKKSRNALENEQKMIKHTCEGTLYSNGRVTIDNGITFYTMTEAEVYYALNGTYTLTFLDEADLLNA